MVGKGKRGLLALCLALLGSVWSVLPAQNEDSGQVDSLLRLEKADYVEQLEAGDDLIRKVANPVFLHNGTYLQCDTSLWSRNTNIINCIGNVVMTQGDAVLTSDSLVYYVDDDLARFRGSLVELQNAEGNVLRTRELDYNTRDSLALFHNGASMRSEDGQIIESDEGSYSNPRNYFVFRDNVNMFTDSVFVRTNELDYDADAEFAMFKAPIDFWKEENMLSARGGWYRKLEDIFFFENDVRALGETQETWSDTLYYYRKSGDIEMHGHVQLQDTSRSVASVSEYLYYCDSLSSVTLLGQAAIALWEERGGKVDTTYCGADSIFYRTLKMCDIPEEEISRAGQRRETIMADPVAEYRRRAAEERAKVEEEARNQAVEDGLIAPGRVGSEASLSMADGTGSLAAQDDSLAVQDSPAAARDSLGAVQDSLAVTDTLAAAPPDTSAVGFVSGRGNIRIFRSDMQVRCDSLEFNELDSIARFYRQPLVWNEIQRQFSADSLFVLVRDGGIDRASLMSNAFIAVQEDTVHYDQISSTEGLAFFDDSTQLRRFDALGNVVALFYLEENDTLSTVNKAEGALMSANLKDGELQSVYYFDSPKNDAYPLVQLSERERMLRGLDWRPQLRPRSKSDVTTLSLRPSAREEMLSKSRPEFPRTEFYFEGYMGEVYASLERARLEKERREREDSRADTLPESDSLMHADSLAPAKAAADSLMHSDSLAVSSGPEAGSLATPLSAAEQRRAERIARREARWAALDERDAMKKEQKELRAQRRLERREAKLARRRERQLRKEEALLQRYIEKYEKQKERDERQQEPDPSRERTPGIEAGGELQPVAGLHAQTP